MSLTANSTLAETVVAVAHALKAAGIRAVLTGGACAGLYSDGAYQSFDVDFVLQSPVAQTALDAALAALGFVRDHDHYVHESCRFWVEFPAGPLGVGDDAVVEPVDLRVGRARVLALSATDSCRDRLAAFYHWDDRQGLETAVEIARHQSVDLKRIHQWSRTEGASRKHAAFRRALDRRLTRKVSPFR